MNIEEYSKYKQAYIDDAPELLLKYLLDTQWNTYLDLGCGDGALLFTLQKSGMLDAKTVYAVDLSENRMRLVKKINSRFICIVAGADDVREIQSESIDFLVSTQVIEHVPSDKAMAKEIKRILKTGSIAYVSTVFKKWYGWYFYRCDGKWVLDPTHVREYAENAELLDILENQGLVILENKKYLIWRSPIDFVLKKVKMYDRLIYNPVIKILRTIRIPILGYYNWEVVCKKK